MKLATSLADVLRAEAEGEDLHSAGHCLIVRAMRKDGTLYEIGSVSAALVCQKPDMAKAAIERIKFGREGRA